MRPKRVAIIGLDGMYLDLPLPYDTDERILHEVTELKEFRTINYLNRWKMLLKARKIAPKMINFRNFDIWLSQIVCKKAFCTSSRS